MQTSVAADVFPKLPAWEDMIQNPKVSQNPACLWNKNTGGKTTQANISYFDVFISSVLQITQSIWQLAHADK